MTDPSPWISYTLFQSYYLVRCRFKLTQNEHFKDLELEFDDGHFMDVSTSIVPLLASLLV